VSQPVHVNSATGIVGPTGAGKSCLIATAAEYLADTFPGAVMLLATADGGGFPTKVQSLVKVGVIRVWRMRTRGEAFETTMQASKGWWPSSINPRSGETAPNVRLVPPITDRYTMRCPQGHVVKTVPFQSLLTAAICPTCKNHVTKETMQVTRETRRTKGFELVKGIAFDGLTSFLNWQMTDLAGRAGRLELKGEESALGGRIQSGDIFLGGNNRAHYGFVQSRAEEMVLNSLGIPGLELPPLWTMLLLETVDEGGLPVKGPKLAGKAKTDEAGAWFGNMLEVGVVKDDKGLDVRRLSLNEFTDDGGVRHLVKHRGGPTMPPYLQDEAGAPWGQVNLGLFFNLLTKDIEESSAAATERFKDAPGVPEGEVSYGETVETTAPAAAAVAAQPVARAAAPTPAPKPVARRAVAPTSAPHPATTETDAPTVAAPQPEVSASAPAAPVARPSPSIAGKAFAPPPAPRPPARAPQTPAVKAPTPIAEKDIPY
jgi:hypothetical protein